MGAIKSDNSMRTLSPKCNKCRKVHPHIWQQKYQWNPEAQEAELACQTRITNKEEKQFLYKGNKTWRKYTHTHTFIHINSRLFDESEYVSLMRYLDKDGFTWTNIKNLINSEINRDCKKKNFFFFPFWEKRKHGVRQRPLDTRLRIWVQPQLSHLQTTWHG